jgi:hypothetical protein
MLEVCAAIAVMSALFVGGTLLAEAIERMGR